MNKLTPFEEQWVQALKGPLKQAHLFPQPADIGGIKQLVMDIAAVDGTYPGGVSAYINNAKHLLCDASNSVNPFAGYKAEIPHCESVLVGQPSYEQIEKIGMEEIEHCAFVLVAGGLGERLGYPGIKLSLPSDIISMTPYLNLFISYLIAYQIQITASSGKIVKLPLAIMTSDDTHNTTLKLIQDNNYFGLQEDQIILMKQVKVPTLLDNEARFAVESGNPYKLLTKPHGHGDVHTLILQNKLTEIWSKNGIRWVVFFQDTNGLVFRSLLVFLGVSAMNNFAMNSIAIPRHPDDAVGAICKLVHSQKPSVTVNVEYNVLDVLLRDSANDKPQVDENGYSLYPGNSNALLLNFHYYKRVLEELGGAMPEFVNPKYKEGSRTEFKTPARLECMMQDFARLFGENDKIGCTQLERWACFSPLKSSLETAAAKSTKTPNTECAFTAESDEYYAAAAFLALAAEKKGCRTDIAQPVPTTYKGVHYKLGPRIVLKPSWATSLQQMMDHIHPGDIKISINSTLVIEGDVDIRGLDLDGTLIVKAEKGAKIVLENLKVQNKGWSFAESDDPDLPPYLKIRGYQLIKSEAMEKYAKYGIETITGNYTGNCSQD